MKKAKFIINASAGKTNILAFMESIIGCLVMNQIVNHVDVVYTHKENDAMLEAEKIIKGEYDFVTAVGGDGTVHDVINGIINGGSETPVAVISAGTANQFASFMDLDCTKESFCKMIMDFHTVSVDVGKINDKYFVNSAAGGLWMNSGFETSMQSKAVFGKLAYFLEGAISMPKQKFRTARLKFTSEEFNETTDTALFVVRNAGNLYGNKVENSMDVMTSGYLNVLIVEKIEILKLPGLFLKFMQGEHLNYPGIKYFKTRALDIEKEDGDDLVLDFDKERFGKLPVHIKAVPKAVKIIVPADA